MSLLKAGIVYSNTVTTVSPTYRSETLAGGGGWLTATLALHESKYHGILNGIDTASWDPTNDPMLPSGFSPGEMAGKATCQKYLRRALGLAEPDTAAGERVPIVACVTRLVPQK